MQQQIRHDHWIPHRPTALEQLWGVYPRSICKISTHLPLRDGPRIYNMNNLFIVMEGNITITGFDNKRWAVGQGGLICLFQGKVQAFDYTADHAALKMTQIQFDGEKSQELLQYMGLSPERPCLQGLQLQQLTPFLLSLEQEVQSSPSYDNLQYMTAFMRLLDELLRQVQALDEDRTERAWLEEGITFLRRRYTEPIRVSDAAAYVNIQRTHFTKVFHERMGISPSAYLRGLRMDKSLELLWETVYSITEIASFVGYSDIVSFTRAFRHHFGASPSQMRARAPSPP